MDWVQDWAAVQGRATSLKEAATFFVMAQQVQSEDPYNGIRHFLLPECHAVFGALTGFHYRHQNAIPVEAEKALYSFFSEHGSLFADNGVSHLAGLKTLVAALSSITGEVSFLLRDLSHAARSITERAFIHLNYSLLADESLRDRWQKAFDSGEPACERLGGVHLLGHGIWGFKAHGEGQRTDLVLQSPIADLTVGQRAGAILVLTEWKRVTPRLSVEEAVRQGLSQAQDYGHGVLAGLELGKVRYVVLVSEHQQRMPPDQVDGGINYRFVNVAIDPVTPSKRHD